MIRAATSAAVSMPIAKQIPCAAPIIAVLMPTTLPLPSTNGPPELPGLSGASVWMTLSISLPDGLRRLRPSALTMPAVTVAWNHSGLPMATTI
jgi:hypothetical protein